MNSIGRMVGKAAQKPNVGIKVHRKYRKNCKRFFRYLFSASAHCNAGLSMNCVFSYQAFSQNDLLFQFVRSILENELQKDAAEDGNAVKYAQNGKVFFMRNIRFKEQQQCHTGVGTQAGQQGGKGQDLCKIQLCQQDRRSTVGNQSDKTCNQRLQRRTFE